MGSLVGQEPNNSVYLAPLVTEVVSSSILLLISYHTKLFARLCIVIRRLVVFLNVLQKRNKAVIWCLYSPAPSDFHQLVRNPIPTLFLITLYYESKFKAIANSTILWINFGGDWNAAARGWTSRSSLMQHWTGGPPGSFGASDSDVVFISDP